MRFLSNLLIISIAATAPVLAAVGGRCTNGASEGVCVSTGDCNKYGGTYTNGNCPWDGNDIKCCSVTNCDYHSTIGWSQCKFTSDGCKAAGSAWWSSNHCPGGDNYKCCNMINKPMPPVKAKARL